MSLLPVVPSCIDAGCSWRFAGEADPADPRRVGVACDDPQMIECRRCQTTAVIRCGTARGSRCAPCGASHKARVSRVAGSGFRGQEGHFVTLTAPGDRAHRTPGGALCPCTPVGGVDLEGWNATAGTAYNNLVRELRRTCVKCSRLPNPERRGAARRRREGLPACSVHDGACGCWCLGGCRPPGKDVQVFRGVEPQKRGALHFHLLVRGLGVVHVARLRRLAIKHGFGHSLDVQPLQHGHAAYVAKYASKAADERHEVRTTGIMPTTEHVDTETGELVDVPADARVVLVKGPLVPGLSRRPTYRTWSASRGWGDSMALVRLAQAHWSAVVAALPSWSSGDAPAVWASVAVPDRPASA